MATPPVFFRRQLGSDLLLRGSDCRVGGLKQRVLWGLVPHPHPFQRSGGPGATLHAKQRATGALYPTARTKASSLLNWLYKRSPPPKAPRLFDVANLLSIQSVNTSEADAFLRSGHRMRVRGAIVDAPVQGPGVHCGDRPRSRSSDANPPADSKDASGSASGRIHSPPVSLSSPTAPDPP